MAVIAIVWELGSGLGHLSRLLPITQALHKEGHRPVLVLRDMTHLALFSRNFNFECIQAPVWREKHPCTREPINYTDTLLRVGYQHREVLVSLLTQWDRIFKYINPSLIFFDHSPTAMLASRKFYCPKINIGTDFSVLPPVTPFPRYKYWQRSSHHTDVALRRLEERCLRNINYALANIGMQRLDSVHHIYETDHTFIDTHPMLDVYGKQENVEYLGIYRREDVGVRPVWPFSNKPKVFVYLKSRYQHIDALLEACYIIDAQFLIYGIEANEAMSKRFASPRMLFSDKPFKINEVIESCDCAINHASGIAELLLQQGKPQLLLPTQMEQMMRSKKIASFGAAKIFDMKDSPDNLAGKIHQLLDDEKMRKSGQTVAKCLVPTDIIPDLEKILSKVEAHTI